MDATSLPLLLTGTASSHPHALWQYAAHHWRSGGAAPFPLHVWTATSAQAITPPGAAAVHAQAVVLWLPTPPDAPAPERLLEQACRSHWMAHVATGGTLRVLYGLVQHQRAALLACIVEHTQPAAPSPSAKAPHPQHRANLRCWECVDPLSEQRLFSQLLLQRPAAPAPTSKT